MEYLVVVTYVIFTRWRKLLPGGYIFILIPLLKKYFKMNNIHFIWYFENCNWKRNIYAEIYIWDCIMKYFINLRWYENHLISCVNTVDDFCIFIYNNGAMHYLLSYKCCPFGWLCRVLHRKKRNSNARLVFWYFLCLKTCKLLTDYHLLLLNNNKKQKQEEYLLYILFPCCIHYLKIDFINCQIIYIHEKSNINVKLCLKQW